MRKDKSIKYNLTLGFGSIILVLGLLVVVTRSEFAQTVNISKVIEGTLVNQIRASDQLAFAVERQQTSLRNYINSGDKGYFRDYLTADNKEKESVSLLKRNLHDDKERRLFEEMQTQLFDLAQSETKCIELINAKRAREALKFHVSTVNPVSEGIIASAGLLAEMGHDEVRAKAGELSAARERAIFVTGSLFLAGLLLALISAVMTTRSVTRPTRRIARAAEAISRGDFAGVEDLDDTPAGADGKMLKNELSLTSAAIRRMALSIEKRERNLEAHAHIGGVCSSTIELDDLAQHALEELADHTRSQIGVVYILRKRDILVHATFGIPGDKALSLTGPDGIVEQVIDSGRPLVMNDVPVDTVFAVDPGLGRIVPRSMVCVPMGIPGHTVGAIALASIYGYDEDTLELIETASVEIGVAAENCISYLESLEISEDLQAAKNRLDTQNEHLQCQNEELQAQSEEIQAQSEEIAAQNEELTSQAVEMQRQNEELTTTSEDLNALQAVTAVALSSVDPEVLTPRLLTAICSLLGLQYGMIMLVEDDGNAMRSRVWHNVDVPEPEIWHQSIGQGFGGMVAESRSMIVSSDVNLDPSFLNTYMRKAGARAVVGLPLVVGDTLCGVAILGGSEPREFSEREKNLLEVFALRTATAIDRAQGWELLHEAEASTRLERDRLHTIIESIPEAVVVSAPDGQLLSANKAAMELIGIRQLTNATLWEYPETYHVLGPGGEPISADQIPLSRTLLYGETCVNEELLLRHEDGKEVPVSVNTVPIFGPDGEIASAVAVFQDISHAKERQWALQRGLEHQRQIAHELQRAFLPSAIPDLSGYEIAEAYLAAGEDIEVGGDFYDVMELGDGRFGIVMADVSGKGIPAAVYTAMAKYMLHGFAHEDPAPGRVLERLNDALARYVRREVFITLFYGVVHTSDGRMVYANGGHEEPLIRRGATGEVESLSGTGPALGIIAGVGYGECEAWLSPEDVLVLYTDGITEARAGKDMLGPDRLREIIAHSPAKHAQDVRDHLLQKVRDFSDGNWRDDVAVLVLKPGTPGI